MTDETAKKKDILLQLLENVELQAERLETLGGEIVRSARLTRDVTGPVRDFISQMPLDNLSSTHWDREVDSLRAWQVVAGELETYRTTVNSFSALSFAVTSTLNEAVMSFTPSLSPQVQANVEHAQSRLRQTLERFPLIDDTKASIRRLGLDCRGGSYRTPFELLTEACGALERPIFGDGGPVSVLITLRECINSVISELLRRRPTQERASKLVDKLISLGRQCARPDLDDAHFKRLAVDGEPLLDALSGAKQAEMPRPQLNALFHRGLLFLNAVMNSIDESRLKVL
jgi:hypothetical protein